MQEKIEYEIICTGWNCEKYVLQCITSVLNQTLVGWTLNIVSDGSTDNTNNELRKFKNLFANQIKISIYPEQKGAAFRRFEAISKIQNKEAVIVLLDLDDELTPDALEIVNKLYREGKYMTYGNYINQYNVMFPAKSLYFDEETHKERSYRQVPYRSTHLKTFKRFLFDNIKESDFKISGEWINATTESPLVFALLEQCGKDKIGVVEKPIYIYNEGLANGSVKRLGQAYKTGIYKQICELPKYNLYERKGI